MRRPPVLPTGAPKIQYGAVRPRHVTPLCLSEERLAMKNRIEGDASSPPFWRTKSLAELDQEEWESLCDGCGQCCLVKLEDEEDGTIYQTRLACRLLDLGTCRCSDYPNRHDRVPDCLRLTPEALESLTWLPATCAYAKVARGEPLEDWHPLLSGQRDSVHEAGVSIRGFAVSERNVRDDAYVNFIVEETK